MKTYKQFLLENTKHIAVDDLTIDRFLVDKGSTYYLNGAGPSSRSN